MKDTRTADRHIDDDIRRRAGQFYTPSLFTDYAHALIEKHFGKNWKEDYIVWDCAWGTGNLTRDYKFKELYASTLFKEELDQCQDINPEATKFQFDFLNDDIGGGLFGCTKLPDGLTDALNGVKGKSILFLINPPYAASGVFNTKSDNKAGCAATAVNKEMIKEGWGKSAQNLYTQFLYRIYSLIDVYGLKNVKLCVFCPPLFLSGPSFGKFREKWLRRFEYKKGVLFKASHFADCSGDWGIGFSIWEQGESTEKNNFYFNLIDVVGDKIEVVGDKDVYNTDGLLSASKWVSEPVKHLKSIDCPNLSSGMNVKNSDKNRGRMFKGSMGYFLNNSNNVDKNAQSVGLFSSAYSGAHGLGISPDNFLRCTALFTARRCIDKNWKNSTDEYLAPDEDILTYQNFEADSIVYSLFDSASNQSSLRNIFWREDYHNIYNEFFWLPRSYVNNLSIKEKNEEVYKDIEYHGQKERYVYKLLFEDGYYARLSYEAKDVLEAATELFELSFRFRENGQQVYQHKLKGLEYYFNAWDAGYYQMKVIWQEEFPEKYKAFRGKMKTLKERLIPQVYYFGFLKE